MIKEALESVNVEIGIPIRHVKDKLYLIGHKITTVMVKGEAVLIKVGGGFETLEKYLSIRNQ